MNLTTERSYLDGNCEIQTTLWGPELLEMVADVTK